MKCSARMAFITALLSVVGAAQAAPVDRKLDIVITVEGQQDWRNELQWSKATTTQRYEISTTLRSDGTLEGANLLDLDTDRRLAIKTEYLRRQGVALLKAQGLDPASPELQRSLSSGMQKESFACAGEAVCMSKVYAKYSTLMAAAMEPDNSALFEQGDKKYLFFSGYSGCVNRIRSVLTTHTEGETGIGRDKDRIYPYKLDLQGDYDGSAADRQSLCTRFTVTLDTQLKKLYVENIPIPSSRGKSMRTEFGKTVTTEADLAPFADLQGWANALLRETTMDGKASATLPMTLPLDGNSTVLGNFTGLAKVSLQWSWSPVPASGG